MSRAALKRVEAWFEQAFMLEHASERRDLRAVVALAREAEALKARVVAALAAIPSRDMRENEDASSEEPIFAYSRVSERTIANVEKALAPPRTKPSTKRAKPARGKR